MMSKMPTEIKSLRRDEADKEILRIGLIAELDAINLYEQLASMTKNKLIRKVLLDIAKEEKTHVGEFLELLLEKDKEQVTEITRGKEEVNEMR